MAVVADTLMPAVVDAVDLDEAIDRVDINHVVQRVDVNELAHRVDLQGLIEELDLDALLDHVDIDRLLDRVAVDRLLDRVDVERLLRRVGVDALVRRIDANALVQRVDVDALIQRVDVDALIERVDVDALIQRVDVNALVDRVNLEDLTKRLELSSMISKSTGGLLRSFLDVVRRQVVGLDVIALRIVDRVLRRKPGTLAAGPPSLVSSPTGEYGAVSGRYVGPVSRLLAFLADIWIAGLLFAGGVATVSYVWKLMSGHTITKESGIGWTIALVLWDLVYFWLSWSVAGRTVGMMTVGIRIVGVDGSPITQRQSFLRVLAFPFSFILLIGFLMALFQRQRRAFPDLAAKTCVVYDWRDRPAEMPAPLTRWLTTRGAISAPG